MLKSMKGTRKGTFFVNNGIYLFVILTKSPIFVESCSKMQKKEILTLQEQAFRYKEQIDKCADVIKMLQGYTPDQFTFTFAIGSAQIISFDIQENESDFCTSFFMSWHALYSRKLNEIRKALLSAGVALAVEGVPGI